TPVTTVRTLQPAAGEGTGRVPVPERQAPTTLCPDPGDDAVEAVGDLPGRLAARAGVRPDRPAGDGLPDLRRGDPLGVPVVPLGQVLIDLGVGEAGELGGTTGALAGAGQHQVERDPGEAVAQRPGAPYPPLCHLQPVR